MSNTEHTPTPWMHLQGDEGIYTVLSDGCRGTMVARVPSITPTDKANAERIVACVNACEGIDNPESFIENAKDLYNMLDKVTQQRNLLLEAIVAIAELHPVQEGGREGCFAKASKLAQEARFKAVEDPKFQYNKVIFPQ